MAVIKIEMPPIQPEFDESALRGLDVKRHQLRTSWPDVIHPPARPGNDLRVRLPFEQTYLNAFECMVQWAIRPFVSEQGIVTIYLQGTGGDTEAPECVRQWVETVGQYVAMKDFLALSFALDYEREGGDPTSPQTRIGRLRSRAKPYSGQPSADTWKALDQLVDECIDFLNRMTCYESADCVVGMPPSTPNKGYHLAHELAKRIAKRWKRPDLSGHVRTVNPRRQLKNIALRDKLDALIDTIEVGGDVFREHIVLLVDDLYQSGTTMNYCALQLLQAGARKVFGLALEKTCRNTDNL